VSVLLEALKKAAESKKQNEEGAGEPVSEPAQASADTAQPEETTARSQSKDDTDNTPAASKLSLLETSEDLGLTKPESEPSLATNEPDSMVEAAPQEKKTLNLLADTPAEHEAESVRSIDDLEEVEPAVSVSQLEEDSENREPQEEESSDFALNLLTSSEASVEAVSPADTAIETAQPVQPVQPTDQETILADSAAVSDKAPLSESVERSQKLTAEEEKEQDSYAWSLNALPGYQSQSASGAVSLQKTDVASADDMDMAQNAILTSNKRFKKQRSRTLRGLVFGRSSNWVIYTLLSLLTLSLLSFFAVFYFQDQNHKLEQSMRQYAIAPTPSLKEVRSVTAETQTAEKVDTAEVAQDSSDDVVDQSDPKSSGSTLSDVAQAPVKSVTPASADGEKAGAAPAEKAKLVAASPSSAQSSGMTSQRPVSQPVVQSALTRTLEVSVENVSVRSSLEQAYQALYSGDYQGAQTHFQDVLKTDPRNLSALNGLAAVYAHLGEDDKAVSTYYKALAVSPNNLQAFEGVIALMSNEIAGEEWKKEIQTVLEKHPNSASLNYALGNLFAQERDWEKAQDRYFEAHMLDERNPDYLVNLGVSLDHLGKYPLAAKYYTQALVYADTQQVNFDAQQIKLRLASIKHFMEQNDL
jgi:Flp pilus assembly protein TadD